MADTNRSSFPDRMIPPLEELAAHLLPLKQYARLHIVTELLDVFSSGGWDRIEEEEKERFVRKLERDFHMRAWDDWDWKPDSAFSHVHSLIAFQAKGLSRSK